MTVAISDNLNHEKVQINQNGDQVRPFTKEVIKENKPDYVASPLEIARATHVATENEKFLEAEKKGEVYERLPFVYSPEQMAAHKAHVAQHPEQYPHGDDFNPDAPMPSSQPALATHPGPAAGYAPAEPQPNMPANPLAAVIKAQVNEAVKDAMAKIDIKGMIAQAIADAFKG